MSASQRMKPIVTPWQIAALLAACAAGVWFLLPDDPALLEDLVRDRKTKEARRLLENIPAAERARDTTRYTTLELKLARQELAPGDAAALDRFWRQAADAWRATGHADAVFIEFVSLIPRLADPAAAWALVAPELPRAPAVQQARLATEFVRAALAAAQPAAAAEIFAATRPEAVRTEADRLELARLWQLAGRPADALAALGGDSAPAVETRRVALLLELNRNREAFDRLRARADAAPDRALVQRLAEVALSAGLAGAAAPYLQRQLEIDRGDLALARQLRELLVTAAQPAAAVAPARLAATLSQRAAADVQALARVLEYSGEANDAFDAWLELALAGDLPAVDRLVALNPGLFRDLDLTRALERVVPVPGHDDYTLKLARLEVTLGRYDRAREYFERYLAAAPADAEATVDLARLHFELYRFADAEAVFRRATALRPADPALRVNIAECLVLQGRNDDALALYARLAQETPTEEILGAYVRLAESLGRPGEFGNALRRRIDTAPTAEPRDYLLLAYSLELAGKERERQLALEEGLRRAPDNDDLRLQLAFALSAEKNYPLAQTVLATHRRLHEDSAAAVLYLDLMRLNNDTATERSYLRAPLDPALAHDEAVLERVARAREALRELPEAERLWRELHEIRPADFDRVADLARVLLLRGRHAEARELLAPHLRAPTPRTLKLAAEIAEAAGDHRSAEKHQLAYLAAVQTAPATDWGALGDIRLSRGDRTGAKRAYAEALRRLHAQIAPKGGSR